tara:strand:- start:203 stop:313 length:111 start_codon:yes stop_codon:yes gene_type:complete
MNERATEAGQDNEIILSGTLIITAIAVVIFAWFNMK